MDDGEIKTYANFSTDTALVSLIRDVLKYK
jgi:hypothetical protein